MTRVIRYRGCGETVSQQTFNLPISGSNPGAPTICKHIRDKQELVATGSPRLVCLHMVSVGVSLVAKPRVVIPLS